jgi:hypothetical protein
MKDGAGRSGALQMHAASNEDDALSLQCRDHTVESMDASVGDAAAGSFPSRQAWTADRSAVGQLLLRHAGEAARCAQHAPGYFNNRHVGILGAVVIRVNVRIFYQAVQFGLPRCLCYTRTVAPKHSRPRNGSERDLEQVGFWPASERERMNERFAAAMQAAGYGSTMPSTHFGTRNPVAGYRRD